jgi:hypothetical protein
MGLVKWPEATNPRPSCCRRRNARSPRPIPRFRFPTLHLTADRTALSEPGQVHLVSCAIGIPLLRAPGQNEGSHFTDTLEPNRSCIVRQWPSWSPSPSRGRLPRRDGPIPPRARPGTSPKCRTASDHRAGRCAACVSRSERVQRHTSRADAHHAVWHLGEIAGAAIDGDVPRRPPGVWLSPRVRRAPCGFLI